jgi:hypothetical protein
MPEIKNEAEARTYIFELIGISSFDEIEEVLICPGVYEMSVVIDGKVLNYEIGLDGWIAMMIEHECEGKVKVVDEDEYELRIEG